MENWWERAACGNNPFLPPDAWHEVEQGAPAGQGAEALLVCRFACPVRDACAKVKQADPNTVVAGGWYDHGGRYHQHELLETHQAAAYLGMEVRAFVRRKLPVAQHIGWRCFYDLAEIQRVARTRRQLHGTMQEMKLHHLRGERPCALCRAVGTPVRALVTAASA